MHALAAETEIVTREGIRPAGALAGATPALLLPKRTAFGLSSEATFKPAAVVDQGAADLYRVTMTRRKQRKTVTAAAGQCWLAIERYQRMRSPTRRGNYETRTVQRATGELVAGDRLRTVRAQRPGVTGRVPFAIAQGFVFGDGNRASGDRPAVLRIYDQEKDSALFPYFAAHDIKHITGNGKPAREVYGLPRTWKDLPPVDESRSFLLSWLAGYFAADGNLTPSGTARLSSATRGHLEFARGVAAICGVGHGAIGTDMRVGLPGRQPSALHKFSMTASTLPDWFFIITAHLERHQAATRKPADEVVWTVESVEPAGRGPVYAVPDAGALALADDLLIGAL